MAELIEFMEGLGAVQFIGMVVLLIFAVVLGVYLTYYLLIIIATLIAVLFVVVVAGTMFIVEWIVDQLEKLFG